MTGADVLANVAVLVFSATMMFMCARLAARDDGALAALLEVAANMVGVASVCVAVLALAA